MPRSTRGPRPSTNITEDRKAIEQRAREAVAPFTPAKKGHWPFAPEEISGSGSHSNDGLSDGNSQREH